jgi:hypothetical protein
MSEMNTKKQIIAALGQLEASKEQLETKELLADRKRKGLALDPENVDVRWEYAQVLDPYGVCPSFPKAIDQVGREYFACASKSECWVSFDDLPKATVDRLWQRIHAGDFDESNDWVAADWLGPVLFQLTAEALSKTDIAGRVAVRTTDLSCSRLIVKATDIDTSSFALMIYEGSGRCRFGGWIDVRTAKRFPILTEHNGITAHLIKQNQLGNMEDMRRFLTRWN